MGEASHLTKANKQVGIIMGSISDMKVMSEATAILDKFEIGYEVNIVSAHRTPKDLYEYSTTARDRGIKIIIAGAGGAAHLPGMVASLTTLPVIGVPVKTQNLQGMDSLLSIVQMPKGVPVATVAINGSANAAILAAQILGIESDEVRTQIEMYKKEMEQMVEESRKDI